MSQNTGPYADMPREQVDYFSSEARSPSMTTNQPNPQTFISTHGGRGCPHTGGRSPLRPRSALNRAVGGPGGAAAAAATGSQPMTNASRSDIFDKYKMYFSDGNTPNAGSTARSELSASRASEPRAAAPAPRLNLAGQNGNTGRTMPASQPRPLVEPQRQPTVADSTRSVASVHSVASSARPMPSAASAASSVRPTPSVATAATSVRPTPPVASAVSSKRPAYVPNAVPVERAAPQQQYPVEQDNCPTHTETASVTTRASEPQFFSCDEVDQHDEEDFERHDMPDHESADYDDESVPHSSLPQQRGIYAIPDDFSSPSNSEAAESEIATMEPAAARASGNEPPRRASHSRMSRSTASVATVSSVQQQAYGYSAPREASGSQSSQYPNVVGGEGCNDEQDIYAYNPPANQRARNFAARRPEYGQDNSPVPTPTKGKYAELDRGSEDMIMPRATSSDAPESNRAFGRVPSDAQRSNAERVLRAQELERRRQRVRGFGSQASEDRDGSQGTAQPNRPSNRQERDEDHYDEDHGHDASSQQRPSQKRGVFDPEVFDRLSKPMYVTKKFTQQKEYEQLARAAAAHKAEEDRTAEMAAVAEYSWEVPAEHFKFADLQRQNALFVS